MGTRIERPRGDTLEETLALRIEIDHETGCWMWAATMGGGEYGSFCWDGFTTSAHRWVYATFVEPVPVGIDLDHLCRVHRCVNPDHLEPVTHAENLRRGRNENTRIDKRGQRVCRECDRIKNRARPSRAKGVS